MSARTRIRSQVSTRKPLQSELPFIKLSDGQLAPGQLNQRINELFKSRVFSDYEMQQRVPKAVIAQLQKHIQEGTPVDKATADVIAQAIKEWALQHGCTHYTHWFQPLRGVPGEKHDSFVDFTGHERDLHMEFTGDMLLRGEPDASSFPGGGLRATHEARGYTLWDPTSPPFILEGTSGNTLYIPTFFISWTGDALDIKTPLKRANLALSKVATELLHLNGDTDVTSVSCSLGPEQEFFVIDRNFYFARPDLVACGRTVQGAPPSKSQQLEDHYFATMPERILAFIQDVEIELWRLGIPTKTRHNEVAPGQHEMAPIFEESNLASDHNLLLMEVLKRKAARHDLVVLLHEKPFNAMNGSGKHNNWSMATNTGINLLNPTAKPHDNRRFQLFLTACIKAVDMHGDLLRCAVAYSGNDYRLGAHEAPPAIMSVYLGEMLESLVDDLIEEYEERNKEETVVASAPAPGALRASFNRANSVLSLGRGVGSVHRDHTDRNRTSPFAFTGNKVPSPSGGVGGNGLRHYQSTLRLMGAPATFSPWDAARAVRVPCAGLVVRVRR